MSELIQAHDNRQIFHTTLLATVSALALTAYIGSTTIAQAEDDDRPTVWIELGGQFSRLGDSSQDFAPDFLAMRPSIFPSPEKSDRAPLYGFEESGSLLFKPTGSTWQFSASVRYGRSQTNNQSHKQTYPKPRVKYYTFAGQDRTRTKIPYAARFADTKAKNSESHLIVDFQAGKDVGLGLFGNRDASSVVSAGVRFAQFTSRSNITLKSNPDWHFQYKYIPALANYLHFTSSKFVYNQPYYSNIGHLSAARSFRGLGPSISWDASVPFAGHHDGGELTADWGVNAALLFGRQKAETHHQTTQRSHSSSGIATHPGLITVYHHPPTPDHTRSRSIIVPNLGGFAGVSFQYPNAKLSVGYRADFFFGAMDGGIDTRQAEDRSFYGPFATVSIGLGG